MGVFFNCICVPGRKVDQVHSALGRWLSARGYQESMEPVLFDLDSVSERSAFLVSNDRWTLVFYSHFDEERRLIHELREQSPLLYLWVWDSDVWGWDLFEGSTFAGSFSSDPHTHVSFDHVTEQRPSADPARLCELLGLEDEQVAAVANAQHHRSPFAEDACLELCRQLDAQPAASSYDELETGRVSDVLEGWDKEQVVYFHYEAATAASSEMDLHKLPVDPGWLPSPDVELPPELAAEMERIRKGARRTLLWMRPLGQVAGMWRKGKELVMGPGERPEPGEPESRISVALTSTQTRHQVLNERHGVMIILPQGVDALKTSGKPSAVFAFRVGDLTILCTARRLRHLDEALRPPGRAELLHDEVFEIDELPSRHLRFRLLSRSGRERGEHLDLIVVQSYRALYVFHYRFGHDLSEDTQATIRAAVRSFRVFDESWRRDASDEDTIIV
ncbi:MAG: hypothetical protein MPN21_18140 [Thermoanaerobaculia bacterium]|nr:hypothetical protein [Thermoanaerobaculia bacterium]